MSNNPLHTLEFRVQKYGTVVDQKKDFINTFTDETATADVGVRYKEF